MARIGSFRVRLEAAGQGLYHRKPGTAREDGAAEREPDAFLHDEWDHVRSGYRRAWCQLRERDVHPQHDDFVARTRIRNKGLLKLVEDVAKLPCRVSDIYRRITV